MVLFAPSAETALATAYLLRDGRPYDHQLRELVGVTSSSSRAFVDGTGLYDEAILYGDGVSTDLTSKLHIDKGTKVVFINFGGRRSAASTWNKVVQPLCKQLRTVIVVSELRYVLPGEATEDIMAYVAGGGSGGIQAAKLMLLV